MVEQGFLYTDNYIYYVVLPKDWHIDGVVYAERIGTGQIANSVISLDSFVDDYALQTAEFQKEFCANVGHRLVTELLLRNAPLSQSHIDRMVANRLPLAIKHDLEQEQQRPSSRRDWQIQGDFIQALKNVNFFLGLVWDKYPEIVKVTDKNYQMAICTAFQIGTDSEQWALGYGGAESHIYYLQRIASEACSSDKYPHLKAVIGKSFETILDRQEKRRGEMAANANRPGFASNTLAIKHEP